MPGVRGTSQRSTSEPCSLWPRPSRQETTMFTHAPAVALIRMARHWTGDHNAPPSPSAFRPGPADVTGPRWPGRIPAGDAHPTCRIARWTIVAGIVFLAGSIAATMGLHAVPGHSPRPASGHSSRPASGYLLTASDADFTAMFPGRPLRIEKTAETTSVIVYLADLPGHAVGIICAPVPAPGSFSLDRAVVVSASALPGGQVISRRLITYHGRPARKHSHLRSGRARADPRHGGRLVRVHLRRVREHSSQLRP